MQMNAHFHAVHLFAVMTKLLPEWLPRSLFDLLHRQWNSPERRARSAARLPLLNNSKTTLCSPTENDYSIPALSELIKVHYGVLLHRGAGRVQHMQQVVVLEAYRFGKEGFARA